MNRRCVWIAALAGLCLAWYGTARAVTITAEAGAYVASAGDDYDLRQGPDDVVAYAEVWSGTPPWDCPYSAEFCGDFEAAYGAAWGTADGNIRVGAGHYLGYGYEFVPADGEGYASVTWSDNWYVDTNNPSFDFTVNQGWLSVGGSVEGSGTLTASYLIEVTVGGSLAWRSEGTLQATYNNDDSNGDPLGWSWSYANTKDLLGGSASGWTEYWDNDNIPDYVNASVRFQEKTFSINLTSYAGSFVPITYYMEVRASDPTASGWGNWSEARFGDPFPPPQPVPEPGTMLLVGSGLAGLAAARRRRRGAAG